MTDQLQPVLQVNDGLFNSASHIKVDLNNPTEEMICLSDIAIGLGNICRFGGQIPNGYFYSVAQHSVFVALLVPRHLRMAALFHDATEAYLGDVIKPLKVMLGETYLEIEQRFEAVICKKFQIAPNDLLAIKPHDQQALEVEFEWLYKGGVRVPLLIKQQIEQVMPHRSADLRYGGLWTDGAAVMFTNFFHEIQEAAQ